MPDGSTQILVAVADGTVLPLMAMRSIIRHLFIPMPAAKGTWVRIFHPPVEGKPMQGFRGVDIGDKIRVQLVHTDVGEFIDFKKVRARR